MTLAGVDESRAAAIGAYVRDEHLRAAARPVVAPDDGAFLASPLIEVLPIVADACRLRNDVLYACRQRRRTTLVSGANAGLFRLLCAEHVVEEVEEHSREWTDGPTEHRAFLGAWREEYLPLLRVVPIDDQLEATLSTDERRRIELLRDVDPDDVPSAVLALVLGAFYLTNDRHAFEAVYGGEQSFGAHSDWVGLLGAAGDAGELGKLVQGSTHSLLIAGAGMVEVVRWLANRYGHVVALAVASSISLALVASPQRRHRMRSFAKGVGELAFSLLAEQQSASEQFAQALCATPSWADLSASKPDGVLLRASLRTLARSGRSPRRASELAGLLPALGVPQGEDKVRATLRSCDAFQEVYRGRWQVGTARATLHAGRDGAQ
ncbi:MAG: hypothetical protein JNK12_12485 [Acidimicrobiales bacterium]|nr:hypothetical protein [Acidimicrobiales bacterium]